jgi:ribonuclease BN (tRNA processing enzyme)
VSLQFEVLGFAGAAPLNGACSGYCVSGGGSLVLLDCGPGTLERLWRRELLGRLDAIVVSHMHADHVLDLLPMAGDVVRSLVGGRRPRLCVPHADGPEVLKALGAAFARGSSTSSRFDAAFDVCGYRPEDRLQIGELVCTFAPTAHPRPCFAIRVTDGDAAVVYGADGSPSEAVATLAAGADLLVLEATFADDAAAAAEHGHMTAAQAGVLAARAGAARLLLTHLLPDAGDDYVRHAARSFSGPIELAREGLRYRL